MWEKEGPLMWIPLGIGFGSSVRLCGNGSAFIPAFIGGQGNKITGPCLNRCWLYHMSQMLLLFLLFHGECVRGDFPQFQGGNALWSLSRLKFSTSAWKCWDQRCCFSGKAENCFRSIVSGGFTLELSQSRGAFLQAAQACGASGSSGGVQPIQTEVLDFTLQRLSHSNTKVLLIQSAAR